MIKTIHTSNSDENTSAENNGINKNAPIIAITMGDPSGIGPELVNKVLASFPTSGISARILIIGDPKVMEQAGQLVKSGLNFKRINKLSEASFLWPNIDVLCPVGVNLDKISYGIVDAEMGKAVGLCLQEAANLAMNKMINGIVSTPLNKESFHLAGYNYRDELAYLADLTNSPEPFIGGVVDQLFTITIAEHVPFKNILALIKKDRVLSRIELLDNALRRAGFSHPRIGVAALNVHGGDGGLFGNEEIDEIAPAIKDAQLHNIDARGPIPADAIFVSAFAGDFDGVVCMYHDQANIARKLQSRKKGATLFLGLPVMCATTAHGTAFDLAGKGIADAGGLETALRWTARLAV